jgi:hypothetical protein
LVNEKTKIKNTPLLNAASARHWSTVSKLIVLGADLSAKNKNGFAMAKISVEFPLSKAAIDLGIFKRDISKLLYSGVMTSTNKKVGVRVLPTHLEVKVKKMFGKSEKSTFEWSTGMNVRITGNRVMISLPNHQELMINIEGDPMPLKDCIFDILKAKFPVHFLKLESDKIIGASDEYKKSVAEYEAANVEIFTMIADDDAGSKKRVIEEKVGRL